MALRCLPYQLSAAVVLGVLSLCIGCASSTQGQTGTTTGATAHTRVDIDNARKYAEKALNGIDHGELIFVSAEEDDGACMVNFRFANADNTKRGDDGCTVTLSDGVPKHISKWR